MITGEQVRHKNITIFKSLVAKFCTAFIPKANIHYYKDGKTPMCISKNILYKGKKVRKEKCYTPDNTLFETIYYSNKTHKIIEDRMYIDDSEIRMYYNKNGTKIGANTYFNNRKKYTIKYILRDGKHFFCSKEYDNKGKIIKSEFIDSNDNIVKEVSKK